MEPEVVEKPWGHEIIIADESAYGAKILVVKAGEQLSLQRHQQRDETWYVLKGTPRVSNGKDVVVLRAGDLIQIPRGQWHRLEGHREEARVLEITNGYIDGDIERKEDKYGRQTPSEAEATT